MQFVRAIGRRRAATSVVVAALSAAAFVVPGTSGAVPGQADSTASANAEYDEIMGHEAALVTKVEDAQAERVRLTVELDSLQAELKESQEELVGAQVELGEAEGRARSRQLLASAAETEAEQAAERLRSQIVSSYVTGGADGGAGAALLRISDGDEAGQVAAYSRAVVGESDVLVRELEAARASQRAASEAASTAEAAAEAQRERIEQSVAFISAAVDRQQEIVEEVNVQVYVEVEALGEVRARKALVERRIDDMKRASDRLTLALALQQADQPDWPAEETADRGADEAADEAANRAEDTTRGARPDAAPDRSPDTRPGGTPDAGVDTAPVESAITTPIPGYRIGSGFGPRRHPILDVTRLHAGGDITAPSGTPIHAVADGQISMAGVRGGYGNAVVIDHGNSLSTLSAHLSEIAVGPGEVVERGDVIGSVGSTGLSTGPHLHLETRIKGVPVDPEGVIDFEAPVDYGNGNRGR
ncbi:hypothetical protein BH20ACT3_BH20ACT3_13140 [soil metagenome]